MLKWQRKHNRYHNEDDSEVSLWWKSSKKIRAQECSDDNMIAGMASTEIHKIKLN